MKKNIFGTDGIRAKVGHNILTEYNIYRLGTSIAKWATIKFNNKCKILIGHDTRISSDWIKNLLKAGLLTKNVEVHDAKTLSTPAIYKILQKKFDCGIIISASHNPFTDNGIKIACQNGKKITEEDEFLISKYFYEEDQEIDYKNLGIEYYYSKATDNYVSLLKTEFPKNFLQNINIVLDCANGATYRTAPEIFKYFGAEVNTINNLPNGTNINENCGALHPQNASISVVQNKAQIGFCFDGDGDRVVLVDKNGEIKNGDDILAILAQNKKISNQHSIVGTIMTNEGLTKYLKQKLIRASVGEKHICKKLYEKNLLLGGEPSGHIIFKKYLDSSDGIYIALLVLETIIYNNNWELKTFTKFPNITTNIPIKVKKDLNRPPISDIIASTPGRVIIRYSGTEPLLRVLVEGKSQTIVEITNKKLIEKLNKEFEIV